MLNKQNLITVGSIAIAGLIVFVAVTIAPLNYSKPSVGGVLADVGGGINDQGAGKCYQR